MAQSDIVIVGAGLAGLSCAAELNRAGVGFEIVEAADGVGGRVRTDVVEGFRLDRGFQVYLSAYPEGQRALDYAALRFRKFAPGVKVRFEDRWHRLGDPWRDPFGAWETIRSPIGTLSDKLKVAWLRRELAATPVERIYSQPETTTREALIRRGFTPSLVERFFRPFLGGILLDRELEVSSRMFEFVFKMLAAGDTLVPEQGMGAIPAQLAGRLPAGSIRLNSRVEAISTGGEIRLTLGGGETLRPRAVVLAVEGPEAYRLLGEVPAVGSRGVTCLYFATDNAPLAGPWLYLNGDGRLPVNQVAVLSEVAEGYAPPGAALISATVLGRPAGGDSDLVGSVRDQMVRWFGGGAYRWRHLRTYRIEHAHPAVSPLEERSPRLRPGVYLCGDYRATPSIHHAMRSGRLAAEALLEDGAV